MSDESRIAAGKRFSRDMRLVREDGGTSLEQIHKETRIARSLIESFEEGGLYDHPTFNEVYLRSFVRAYAETIGISPEEALEGLNSALEGDYENELAERYLGTAAPESLPDTEDRTNDPSSTFPADATDDESNSPSSPAAGGPEGRGGIVGPPRAVGAEEGDTSDETETVSEGSESTRPSDASEEEIEGDEEPSGESASVDEPEETEETTRPDHEGDDQESTSDDAGSAKESTEQKEEAADDASELDEKGTEEDESRTDDETESETSTSDDHPDWLDEQPDGEESTPAQPETDSPVPPAEPSEEGGAEPGGSGIVGEPTALGDESGNPPPESSPSGSGSVPRSNRDAGWQQFFSGARREMVWAGLGIFVILLVLVGLTVAYFSAQEPRSEPTRTTAPDTTATSTPDTASAPDRPPPANVRLGDTLHVTVLATADVSGIRIQRDDDLRRPYWIEDGDISVFPFREELIIENELNNIRLFLEGYPYRLSATDTTAELVITRSQAAAFVDTLRGAPATFTAQPDTIPVGAPTQQ